MCITFGVKMARDNTEHTLYANSLYLECFAVDKMTGQKQNDQTIFYEGKMDKKWVQRKLFETGISNNISTLCIELMTSIHFKIQPCFLSLNFWIQLQWFVFILLGRKICVHFALRLTIYQIFIARTNVICQLDGVHFLQFIFRARRQWTNPMVYIAE